MKIVMKIIEKLSWFPRNFLLKRMEKDNKEFVNIDFNKIGINKKIKFYTLKEDKGLSIELKAFGFREPLNSKEYYNFISQEDIVLDIGSNLGYFPILASSAKKIICIEPIKNCVQILKKNLTENKIINKSTIINKAVGEKGKMFIEISDKINHSKIVIRKSKNSIKVKSETISYLVNKFKANVLRMDLEGYEYDLLYKKIPSRINKISLEFHRGIIGKRKTEEFLEYMQKEGFVIKTLVQEIPLRLYPFYGILKKTLLIKKFTYIKKDIMPKKALPFFFGKRSVKHLNFERMIK